MIPRHWGDSPATCLQHPQLQSPIGGAGAGRRRWARSPLTWEARSYGVWPCYSATRGLCVLTSMGGGTSIMHQPHRGSEGGLRCGYKGLAQCLAHLVHCGSLIRVGSGDYTDAKGEAAKASLYHALQPTSRKPPSGSRPRSQSESPKMFFKIQMSSLQPGLPGQNLWGRGLENLHF